MTDNQKSPANLKQKLSQIRGRGGIMLMPWQLVRALLRFIARKLRVLSFHYLHGIKCGRGVHLGPGIRFVNPGSIRLYDGALLAAEVSLWSESQDGQLELCEGAQVNRRAELDFSGGLVLERNALVSAEAIIYTHDHGHDPRSEPSFSPLRIREGAWIGIRAIILPSVNYIGANAVIGAGAVVTKDVPDGAVFVGAKGRLIQTNDDATQ